MRVGFPIRTSPDQRLLGTSPKRIAAKLRPSSPSWSQGIHRTLLNFLLGNLKITRVKRLRATRPRDLAHCEILRGFNSILLNEINPDPDSLSRGSRTPTVTSGLTFSFSSFSLPYNQVVKFFLPPTQMKRPLSLFRVVVFSFQSADLAFGETS